MQQHIFGRALLFLKANNMMQYVYISCFEGYKLAMTCDDFVSYLHNTILLFLINDRHGKLNWAGYSIIIFYLFIKINFFQQVRSQLTK